MWTKVGLSGLIAKFSDQINHFVKLIHQAAKPSNDGCVSQYFSIFKFRLWNLESENAIKNPINSSTDLFGIILIQESIEHLLSQSNHKKQSFTGQTYRQQELFFEQSQNSWLMPKSSLYEQADINNNIWFKVFWRFHIDR